MQILNISVMNRPAHNRVSLVYPTAMHEYIAAAVEVHDVSSRPDPMLFPVQIFDTPKLDAFITVDDVIYSAPPKLFGNTDLHATVVVEDVLTKTVAKFRDGTNLSAVVVLDDVVHRPLIKTTLPQNLEAVVDVHDVVKESVI